MDPLGRIARDREHLHPHRAHEDLHGLILGRGGIRVHPSRLDRLGTIHRTWGRHRNDVVMELVVIENVFRRPEENARGLRIPHDFASGEIFDAFDSGSRAGEEREHQLGAGGGDPDRRRTDALVVLSTPVGEVHLRLAHEDELKLVLLEKRHRRDMRFRRLDECLHRRVLFEDGGNRGSLNVLSSGGTVDRDLTGKAGSGFGLELRAGTSGQQTQQRAQGDKPSHSRRKHSDSRRILSKPTATAGWDNRRGRS